MDKTKEHIKELESELEQDFEDFIALKREENQQFVEDLLRLRDKSGETIH